MKTYKRIFSIVLVTVISLFSFSSGNVAQAVSAGRYEGTLYAEFSKVGDASVDYDADSILLEQNSNFILVDVGRLGDGKTVKSTLTKRGVSKLKALIITHYDADHSAAILDVSSHINNNIETVYGRFYEKDQLAKIKEYSPGDIYINYIRFINLIIRVSKLSTTELSTTNPADADAVYKTAKIVYDTSGGKWVSPNRNTPGFTFGNATLEWKNIDTSYITNAIIKKADLQNHVNNDSLIFRILTTSRIKLLFLGDIGKEGIAELVSSKIDIDCDVLKLSHHGRTGSTTDKLLEQTTPIYSIATCTTYWQDHSLTEETLTRLQGLQTLFKKKGLGKLYYVGYEDFASSTLAITKASVYDFGTLYEYDKYY